jgi:hypothetical protein
MPNSYEPNKNPFATQLRAMGEPAVDVQRLTPSDSADTNPYCKALRVFVPASTEEATVRVTPMLAADDANTVTLRFPSGVSYEPLAIRRLWSTGTSAGIEIHGYTA